MQTPEQNRIRSNEYNRTHREERKAYGRMHYYKIRNTPGFKEKQHEKYLRWKTSNSEGYRRMVVRHRAVNKKWIEEQMRDPEKRLLLLEKRKVWARKRYLRKKHEIQNHIKG